MAIVNLHTRDLHVTPSKCAHLIDRLASRGDLLWPAQQWPAMKLDGGLAIGARGGHGPIRYEVADYFPGRLVRFRFTMPAGFHGFHEFTVSGSEDGAVLQHLIAMRLSGTARLTWPLIYRPLHDAPIEDALDQAVASTTGVALDRARWSRQVRLMRWIIGKRTRDELRESISGE